MKKSGVVSVGYSNRIWECPFFKWDEKKGKQLIVHCEGGRLALPPREMTEYIGRYCGDLEGWKQCPLARALLKHYEEQENGDLGG